jgi:hypothetical protein
MGHVMIEAHVNDPYHYRAWSRVFAYNHRAYTPAEHDAVLAITSESADEYLEYLIPSEGHVRVPGVFVGGTCVIPGYIHTPSSLPPTDTVWGRLLRRNKDLYLTKGETATPKEERDSRLVLRKPICYIWWI